jgi:succinate-semialdehyde dehydrogenase/glutarate-semialdehyde dehydrogenase
LTGFHRHLFLFLKSTIWASDYRIILNIRGDHNFENLAQDSGLIPNPFYHFSTARMMNSGQSCIAAKRFILVGDAYDKFLPAYIDGVKSIKKGDPMDDSTEIGPLARKDLADELHKQLDKSVKKGAKIETGGKQEDAFYEPTVLTGVKPGMPAFDEETFGPVAAIIRAKDVDEAFELAANSKYGLGVSLFTSDIENARRHIGKAPDGAFFINELVKSDPRLPFGGTGKSGYGRELSREGIHEFVNKKTVYIKR